MIPSLSVRRPAIVFWFGLALAALPVGVPASWAGNDRACTREEREAANAELWLNARDKKASIALHLPFGVPSGPADADNESLLVQRDYVIDYDADLRVPIWVGYRLDFSRLKDLVRINCFR